MDKIEDLQKRNEKLSLLIGTMLGQISQLLNYCKEKDSKFPHIYKSLLDIIEMASLQVHELYYKEQK